MRQSVSFTKHGYVLADNKIVPSVYVISKDKLPPLLSASFSPESALSAIREHHLVCRLQPVGVIGPKNATQQQYHMAEQVGRLLANLGLPLLCGGGSGVMEAAAKGVYTVGGTVIGVLPDGDPTTANTYINYVLPSGIGKARNAVIAQAAACLIGIGGGHGTITEMAFGVHFGKAVFALEKKPVVPEVQYIDSIDTLVPALLTAYFQGQTT